jgi:SAM-dependent methyltransferase
MNPYDHPQFLELSFRDETKREANFIEAACQRYGRWPAERMLEPGCGGGRLIVEMCRRGHSLVGFDVSDAALTRLRRGLARRKLAAEVFRGDMARFSVRQRVDAAFCTFNTFRHLLSESDAVRHLQCVARSLRRGGVYVLGLHLLPPDASESCIERWSGRAGRTQVTVTLRVLATARRRRLEWIRLSMLVRRPGGTLRCRHDFALRIYSATQFRRLVRQVPEFELCDVFDFWYDIDDPLRLDDSISDTVAILRKRK